MNRIDMKRKLELWLAVVALVIAMSSFARADVVTEWNQNAQQALLTAKTSPVVSTRVLAIMHVAMFDAVNGIERRYTPIHVDFDAPPGASRLFGNSFALFTIVLAMSLGARRNKP